MSDGTFLNLNSMREAGMGRVEKNSKPPWRRIEKNREG